MIAFTAVYVRTPISILVFYPRPQPLKSWLGFEKMALNLIADSGRKIWHLPSNLSPRNWEG